MTFTNHGCKGTYNTGEDTGDLTEFTADLKEMPYALHMDREGKFVYNPVADRHLRMTISGKEKTIREVKKGEEVLDNYLAFVGHASDWESDVQMLRDQCNGVDVGDVTKYETDTY